MKRILGQLFSLLMPLLAFAQTDSLKEAVYRRPFIVKTGSTAVGGYAEANTNYFSEDGVSEGFSMEMRRFNIFLYSTIGPGIKFLSELEFEHGTREISLETAMIDFEVHPLLTLRGGIMLTPIGDFNLNHDSPRWDFVERPLVSTEIIPSTLSEVGFGVFGRFYLLNSSFSYYAYLLNGLQDGVVFNPSGRTHLAEGKSEEMFAEDNNGEPMYSAKLSFRNNKLGELGLSLYGGTYNTYKMDGVVVDEKRKLHILAVDFKSTLFKRLDIRGEAARNFVEVPGSSFEIYGRRQSGIYVEAIYPFLAIRNAGRLNACLRAEKIDYNEGDFGSTGERIFDEVSALVPGLSFRPNENTVIRANYRYETIRDPFGNAPVKRAGIQIGIASYF